MVEQAGNWLPLQDLHAGPFTVGSEGTKFWSSLKKRRRKKKDVLIKNKQKNTLHTPRWHNSHKSPFLRLHLAWLGMPSQPHKELYIYYYNILMCETISSHPTLKIAQI